MSDLGNFINIRIKLCNIGLVPHQSEDEMEKIDFASSLELGKSWNTVRGE